MIQQTERGRLHDIDCGLIWLVMKGTREELRLLTENILFFEVTICKLHVFTTGREIGSVTEQYDSTRGSCIADV